MKKSIFSKLMACLVVLSCAFVVSACSVFQKENTNIKSIAIDEDSIPEAIVIGKFDEAGIKAIVTYEDNSTSEIDVTTEMIPEEYQYLLETPGIYEITIMFRNATTELTIRMVNSTNIYQVNFYNNKNQLITTQFVYDGEDATLPSDIMSSVDGWALVGWDRSNENISEDTNIYGLYVNIENTLSDAKMQQVLLNAEQYYMTNSHFTSLDGVWTQGEETATTKQTINYHYDSEKEIATSQGLQIHNYGKYIYNFGETEWELLQLDSDYGNYYQKQTYEELRAEFEEGIDGEEPLTDEEFEKLKFTGILYAASENSHDGTYDFFFNDLLSIGEVEFGYEITSNKLIYTCTITIQGESWGDNQSEENIYTIKYDDDKVLQLIDTYIQYYDSEELYSVVTTHSIDYVELEFEDLIPNFGDINGDGEVDTVDGAEIQRYLAGEFELSEEQLLLADVNLDEQVTEYDYQLIQMYAINKIPYLPFTNEAVIELFDKVMQNGLSESGITIISNGKWNDDEGEATTSTMQLDFVNKIGKVTTTSQNQVSYIWESEGVLYEAYTQGDAKDCYKTTGATFADQMNAEGVYMFIGYQMIYGGTYEGTRYEFIGIEIVDGNFVITINASRLEGEVSGTIKYTFNKDYILSVESTYDYTGTYTYDYSDVTIELPEDIKALEDSAIEDND